MPTEETLLDKEKFRANLRQALEGPVQQINVTIQPDHPLFVAKQEEALTLTQGIFIEPHGPLSNPCRERVIPENVRFVPLWATLQGSEQGDIFGVTGITELRGVIEAKCPSCHGSFSFATSESYWYPMG